MVASLNINLTEVFGLDELIKEVVDSGNQVPFIDYDFIQGLIINAESPSPIFLLHQYDLAPTRR